MAKLDWPPRNERILKYMRIASGSTSSWRPVLTLADGDCFANAPWTACLHRQRARKHVPTLSTS